MKTLILRIQGPVQAWGQAGSRYDFTRTSPRPTKSGVVGLVANALGRSRDTDISDLAGLTFSVRADAPGAIDNDYRTAGGGTFPIDTRTRLEAVNEPEVDTLGRLVDYGAPRASYSFKYGEDARETTLRHHQLIFGAAFLVGLTGDDDLIDKVAQALERPARPLALGEKSCPPSHPLLYEVIDGDAHATWARSVPLIDDATVRRPLSWREEWSADAVVSYEQPGRTVSESKQPLPMMSFVVCPTTHSETATALA